MQFSELNEKYCPQKAVIIYKKEADTYAELYPVIKRGGSYELGAGKPLTTRQARNLFKYLNNTKGQSLTMKGSVPSGRLLYIDPNPATRRLVWWRPSEIRKLRFSEKVGIASGAYRLPALIFDLNGSSLSIFASAEAVVNGDSILYHAPLPNISDTGDLCTGNCKKPNSQLIPEIIAGYESVVYDTKFTHFSNTKTAKTNILELYRTLENAKTFPVKQLVALNKALTVTRYLEKNT